MKQILSFFTLTLLLFGCNTNNSEESYLITDLFPFQDGNMWSYEFIVEQDTTDVMATFSASQLSDDSQKAVIELTSNIIDLVFVFEARPEGICIGNPSESFETILENLNSYNTEECVALLKMPINDGAQYSFTYSTSGRSYEYQVEVFQETIEVNSAEYDTFNYVIPSGSEPELFATEIYFNPEKGIVKLIPEAPDRVLNLVSTNF
ncbi:MAG: hypothetical protein WD357_12275 [Gracilimonas sp.]